MIFVKTEFTQNNSSIFEQIVDRGRPICSLPDKSFPISQVSDQFDNVDFQILLNNEKLWRIITFCFITN